MSLFQNTRGLIENPEILELIRNKYHLSCYTFLKISTIITVNYWCSGTIEIMELSNYGILELFEFGNYGIIKILELVKL